MLIASSRLGIDSSMSTTRMMTLSIPTCRRDAAPAMPPSSDADRQPDQGGHDADQQGLPGTDDQPAELVAAEVVDARGSQSTAPGPGSAGGADLAVRAGRSSPACGTSNGAEMRHQQEQAQDHRADDGRPGCARSRRNASFQRLTPRSSSRATRRRRRRSIVVALLGRVVVIAPSPSGR